MGKFWRSVATAKFLLSEGRRRRVFDVKGRTVVPGIIDTHSHLFDYAMDSLGEASPRMRIRAQQTDTWDTVKQKTLEAIQQEVAKRKPGEWIALDLPRQAIGKDGKPMDAVQAAMRGQVVTRAELDKVAPNNPVYITHPDFFDYQRQSSGTHTGRLAWPDGTQSNAGRWLLFKHHQPNGAVGSLDSQH